jgi:hypothetical protein
MRIEFAKIQFMDSGARVNEVAHLGDVDVNGGRLRFAEGIVEVQRFGPDVQVDLSGLRNAGLFHGRHLRRRREIGIGKDGGGCIQIDQNWMLVVHTNGTSGIYERLGRKAYESYWHL